MSSGWLTTVATLRCFLFQVVVHFPDLGLSDSWTIVQLKELFRWEHLRSFLVSKIEKEKLKCFMLKSYVADTAQSQEVVFALTI